MNKKDSHKNYCANYNGTLSDLAVDIGAMTHEARAELFKFLANYVEKQSISDSSRGRVKYAKKLNDIADLLKQIKNLEDQAWDICKSRTNVVSK